MTCRNIFYYALFLVLLDLDLLIVAKFEPLGYPPSLTCSGSKKNFVERLHAIINLLLSAGPILKSDILKDYGLNAEASSTNLGEIEEPLRLGLISD